MSTKIPSYEPLLAAFHRAYAGELREIVRSLPIQKGQTVLDLACGDGAYTPWLSEGGRFRRAGRRRRQQPGLPGPRLRGRRA
ncbi:MAG: hypothetical protein U0835_14575 [Isosphaeraceae bacterium]